MSEDDSEPPKWLTASFIESAIKEDNIKVNSLTVENAVAVGENYTTTVYRATGETSAGLKTFIIKCVPQGDYRKNLAEHLQVMLKEIRMYKQTLPLIRGKLLHPQFPRCYHVQKDSTCETLVLEDLRSSGFRTSPRQQGLDVTHCRLAIKELAYIHGLSAALRIQQPDVFKSEIQDIYEDIMYSEKGREISVDFIKKIFPSVANSVRKNLPFRFNEISYLIDGMVDTAFDDLRKDMNEPYLPENEDKLKDRVITLNHGDYWSNNILYQYKDESEKPNNCFMIDFQLTRCSSPALDIQYFLYTSTTQETRRAHLDELLQLYLDEANAALRFKGVTDAGKKFYKSVEEIKEDMKRHANFGFMFSSCIVLPIVIADTSKAPDYEEMSPDDGDSTQSKNPFDKIYSGPLFVKRFTEILEDFDDIGYFKRRVK